MAQSKEERREKRKEYYKNNRERLLGAANEYARNNKDLRRAYAKKYLLKTRTAFLEKCRLYARENREHYSEIHKKWIAENPEMKVIYNQRRRAKDNGLTHGLTKEEWLKTLEHFNGACAYCGSMENLQQDHVLTVSRGGHYEFGNIVPACRRCNANKHTKLFSEWYPKYTRYNKMREERVLKFISIRYGKELIGGIENG